MLSEVFWIAFIATASGMVIKLASMCHRSKCKEIKLCGGRISCIRDTDVEEKFDEFELTHRQNTPESPK